MKIFRGSLVAVVIWAGIAALCNAQSEPKAVPATSAILDAFRSHDLVMLGEMHGNKQEYDWLRDLVADSNFDDTVDDIVMEFGNSLYQRAVDRYETGEDVPTQEVQGAWRDTVASVGPPSPVYSSLYDAVREANLKHKGKHQIRVLCGDPAINWQEIKDGEQLRPYVKSREQSYAEVVEKEVIAKHHHALLIMGTFHFLRHFPARMQFDIEQQLRDSGAKTYLIVMGTGTTGNAAEVDHRFDSWPVPSIVALPSNWVGELPAMPVVTAGHGPRLASPKLEEAADALLYLGPPTSLSTVPMSPSELVGTSYGAELERRQKLQMSLEK